MMEKAQERMQAGDYEGACDLLSSSSSAEHILMLFGCQLRCARFDEGIATLDRLAGLEPKLASAIAQFRGLTRCEIMRTARANDATEAGRAAGMGPPPPHVMGLVRLRTLVVGGTEADANEALEALQASAPKQAGTLRFARGQEKRFSDVWDSDDQTGPTLPVFVSDGAILDIPYSQLLQVTFLPVQSSYDALWRPVEFVTRDGGRGRATVAGQYEGSGRHATAEVRNGQLTLWEYKGDVAIGRGQRDFKFFDDEGGMSMVGIGNVASITFDDAGSSTSTSTSTSKQQKPGFFQRLFGKA